jgi:hypothetical protein
MDKEHLKLLSEVEQSGEFITQNFPPLWWGIYQKCMDVGFTKEQSLSLTKQYMHSTLVQIRNLGDFNAD